MQNGHPGDDKVRGTEKLEYMYTGVRPRARLSRCVDSTHPEMILNNIQSHNKYSNGHILSQNECANNFVNFDGGG
jgi:hypothetical protein